MAFTRIQPALADMLTEEVLQEMVLMSPSSVEEVFGFESLSQWCAGPSCLTY